jgi:hypothetical protein
MPKREIGFLESLVAEPRCAGDFVSLKFCFIEIFSGHSENSAVPSSTIRLPARDDGLVLRSSAFEDEVDILASQSVDIAGEVDRMSELRAAAAPVARTETAPPRSF